MVALPDMLDTGACWCTLGATEGCWAEWCSRKSRWADATAARMRALCLRRLARRCQALSLIHI
eukprot:99722-Amphidinium_carterae.1